MCSQYVFKKSYVCTTSDVFSTCITRLRWAGLRYQNHMQIYKLGSVLIARLNWQALARHTFRPRMSEYWVHEWVHNVWTQLYIHITYHLQFASVTSKAMPRRHTRAVELACASSQNNDLFPVSLNNETNNGGFREQPVFCHCTGNSILINWIPYVWRLCKRQRGEKVCIHLISIDQDLSLCVLVQCAYYELCLLDVFIDSVVWSHVYTSEL